MSSSHDEHSEPIVRTTPKRLGQGIAIVAVTLAIGAAILIPFFNDMIKNPPPVTTIKTPKPPGGEPSTPPPAGTTTIAILAGAAVQGNPNFDPNDATVPLGNKIVWDNQDNVPHTATSGKSPEDPDVGKLFDTSIINGGESSDPVDTKDMKVGDVIDYHCTFHPYMTGTVKIAEASAGGSGGSGGGAATGAALEILEGAAVQGNPSYGPDGLTVKKGDVITVTNNDNVPHTATSGTGPDDPNMGKAFDTSYVDGSGGTAKIDTANMSPGEYQFFCSIHPYMKGTFKVE